MTHMYLNVPYEEWEGSMRQGEHTLHGQLGDVFLPDTRALAARIALTAVGKPFEGDACSARSEMLLASGGYALGPDPKEAK